MTGAAARPDMMAALALANPNAVRLADRMAAEAGPLGLRVTTLGCGARLIDAGVEAGGSCEAGRLFAEACLGGLGRVVVGTRPLGNAAVLEAGVAVDAPVAACLGSQYAGWQIRKGKFFGMGSGPARALAAAEPLFARLGLRAEAPATVILFETSTLPGDEVAEHVASRCRVAPAALTLVAAATGSLAGSIQIAARSVETALHKLLELDFDVTTIVGAAGRCPVAPGTADAFAAIGRTNDAVLYGGDVTLWLDTTDAAIEAVAPRVPSSASKDHGRPFAELFRQHGGDFYKIDPLLFSPARVTFLNARTGRTFANGRLDEALLLKSFGLPGARP